MPDYSELFSAASQLPLEERVRLIDELTDTIPDLEPGALSPEWLEEIERRSDEIESGAVDTVPWETVRADLFRRVGLDSES